MPTLHVAFTGNEWDHLDAWRERYCKSMGIDSSHVTWAQILLAYANSKVLP